ncbi:MAG: ribonuclease Y [bacterium]|nr:ribonuclease Y [bacterium]
MDIITLVSGVVALLIGIAVGYVIRQSLASKSVSSVEGKIKTRLKEAEEKSLTLILEAEKKSADILAQSKNDERDVRNKLEKLEERIINKEEDLNKRINNLEGEQKKLGIEAERIKKAEHEIEELKNRAVTELAKVAKLSESEAREKIISEIREKYRIELAELMQKLEKEKADNLEKKGLDIITTAVQRYARSHISELTTSVFNLPSEEFKGKIIGREGRNIRALERETGVEFIVDETPDAIIISSFDPLRREIAKLALEKLVADGRIQPAKIEEKVEEARQEINKRMHEIGEAAAFELGIYDLPKEIIQLLGRLHFRTSFGQNVLTHSIEMAYISGMLAAELGANVEIAKKGALVHDIGKAIDHDVEGTHVELGRKILKKYGIDEKIIQAMESHHEEYPFSTPESYIVTAADVLSAARPGARRGTSENYFKRLEDLEKIASSFAGVKTSYAIAAGRELRIFVIPEKIDDFGMLQLARDIALKVQSELKYPGEIKVNVIRESRAVEYAR